MSPPTPLRSLKKCNLHICNLPIKTLSIIYYFTENNYFIIWWLKKKCVSLYR